ncbi:cytochrome c [Alishewanella sp. SMS8]|uniref:c-type cytochrome n=1 Tax=unclassified Alishewanella TaxID=2628974 RepID=UPI0027413654|nr:c-type cytochrome [Alishewanella sp. SMS8]MDP4945196.1 c-type cytochrome [Alishewanella sp.]MDP5036571.1 c-type cytochrome [Alishewanella sp.]MDP5187780.1 c-type cytochrome [Alishewanella sp.]MDP5459131.1 c-type cytochrome [Alishewanella sp. SMS8]
MKKIILPLALLFGLVGTAHAFDGDAEAGKAKSATCAACHGPDGNSVVTIYPKLAGQHAEYLYKQLTDYKLGMTTGGKEGRANAIMYGMVAALSDQDMQDLAAYFSSQRITSGTTPEEVIEVGQKLYRGGDADRGIPACIACHGPRGAGTSLAGFPRIGFQNADYVKATLEEFRAGTRANDMNGMMRDVAKKLTDDDIKILSQYLGGLH